MWHKILVVIKDGHAGRLLRYKIIHLLRVVYHARDHSEYHDREEESAQELLYNVPVELFNAYYP